MYNFGMALLAVAILAIVFAVICVVVILMVEGSMHLVAWLIGKKYDGIFH